MFMRELINDCLDDNHVFAVPLCDSILVLTTQEFCAMVGALAIAGKWFLAYSSSQRKEAT
jgi:hypothetical protein